MPTTKTNTCRWGTVLCLRSSNIAGTTSTKEALCSRPAVQYLDFRDQGYAAQGLNLSFKPQAALLRLLDGLIIFLEGNLLLRMIKPLVTEPDSLPVTATQIDKHRAIERATGRYWIFLLPTYHHFFVVLCAMDSKRAKKARQDARDCKILKHLANGGRQC